MARHTIMHIALIMIFIVFSGYVLATNTYQYGDTFYSMAIDESTTNIDGNFTGGYLLYPSMDNRTLVEDGIMYIYNRSYRINAYDLDTKTVLWRKWVGTTVYGALPAIQKHSIYPYMEIIGDDLYVHGYDGLIIIDKNDGSDNLTLTTAMLHDSACTPNYVTRPFNRTDSPYKWLMVGETVSTFCAGGGGRNLKVWGIKEDTTKTLIGTHGVGISHGGYIGAPLFDAEDGFLVVFQIEYIVGGSIGQDATWTETTDFWVITFNGTHTTMSGEYDNEGELFGQNVIYDTENNWLIIPVRDSNLTYVYEINGSNTSLKCKVELLVNDDVDGLTYDFETSELYVHHVGSTYRIYLSELNSCSGVDNPLLVGGYGVNTNLMDDAIPYMTDTDIWVVVQNSSSNVVKGISRNNYSEIFSGALTKDIYNSSLSGKASISPFTFFADDLSGSDLYLIVDGVAWIGMTNVTSITSTTTTTTTSTIPGVYQCNTTLDCPPGWLCENGTCVVSDNECFIDADCGNPLEYCQTNIAPNLCRDKWQNGSYCFRDHECLSNNCTVHQNNSLFGDYPEDDEFYTYVGVCIGSDLTACEDDSDCNATSYCNKFGGSEWGVCVPKNIEGEYCADDSWCAGDLKCINGQCVNETTYLGDECNPNNPSYYYSGQPIWETCYDQNETICPGPFECFCGLQTNTSTRYTCINRFNLNQKCHLFLTEYQSIEYRYSDRDEACDIDATCRGHSTGTELMRICVQESYECVRNRNSGGNMLPNTFIDEYCLEGYYCNNATNICLQQKEFGKNCTADYECASYSCTGGRCSLETPGAGVTSVEITSNKYTVNSGRSLDVKADYIWTQNRSKISFASCEVTADPNFFNISDEEMQYVGGTGRWYISYSFNAKSVSSDTTRNVEVTCAKSGVPTTSNYVNITILGTGVGTGTLLLCNPCPSESSGRAVLWGVNYRDLDGNNIQGATCNLYIDGTLESLMDEFHDGRYTYGKTFTTPDTYQYNVTCSKSGWQTASTKGVLVVKQEVCENGKWDSGYEDGVDCGGVCPTPCETKCSNDYKDWDESDTDCGGSSSCRRCGTGEMCNRNSDCSDDLWCRPHWGNQYDTTAPIDQHCRDPSCEDGWQNGGESGIDCGGPCALDCPCSDRYSLDGCAGDGRESCVPENGTCKLWLCDTDADCPPLLLRENGLIVSKERICHDEAICLFKSGTDYPNATINMRIYPLSNVIYQSNVSNFYISYCNDYTNGFRVVTEVSTHTQYQIGSSPNSPSIPATGYWDTFGVDGTDKSDRIDELCAWTSGSLRYGRIGIHSERLNTNIKIDQMVDTITFKEKFYANFTALGDRIELRSNRNAYFFIRGRSYDPFVRINSAPSTIINVYYLNITNTSSIEWLANSTYGEQDAGRYTRNAVYLLQFSIGFIWDMLLGWWLPTWSYWLIIPIVFGVVVILPLSIAFFIYMYLKSREARVV